MTIHHATKALQRIQLQPEDAPTLYALVEGNRAHLSPWLPWVSGTREVADSLAFITHSLEASIAGTALRWGILADGQLAGMLALESINSPPKTAHIGYWLAADQQGRGLIRKLLPGVIEYGFETLGLTRLDIRARPDNLKSRAIPLALGFEFKQRLPAGEKMGNLNYDLEQFSLYSPNDV